MSGVRVKICGITRGVDAAAAVAAGADALGFVMWAGSPRAVDVSRLDGLVRDIPPAVDRVGVFVNATREAISIAAGSGRLTKAQLHGEEGEAFCRSLRIDWYRAFRVDSDTGIAALAGSILSFGRPTFMLDTRGRTGGGTGRTFDWRVAAKVSMRLALSGESRLILAGGLTAENVGLAIRTVRPWGVDVSSGVESEPGIKDPARLAAFIEAARGA